MTEVVHSKKSDSPGYTRHYFDEPIGTAQGGVLATGPKMKSGDGTEVEFSIVFHGQEVIELPNEVHELKFEDGSTIKFSKSGN